MSGELLLKDLRTLVIGAGVTGAMVVRRMRAGDYDMPGTPVALVDDDPEKQGSAVEGVPVAGGLDHVAETVRDFNVRQIVFAIPSLPRDKRAEVYGLCLETPARLVTLPHILGTPIAQMGPTPFLQVDPADLLARPEVRFDVDLASSYLKDETVLVTGGGGSIGSEICRQLVHARPRRIVIFDIYENTAYELLRELEDSNPASSTEFVVEIGSVRDVERLRALFDAYEPAVVFHAAAHKHVPLMERNPREAVLNNVVGTLNVVRQANEHGVRRFVFISTDKAVNPTNVMGATKRFGEMIVQYYAAHSGTVFSAVRFGNVLGSHGSVIPLFERQIEHGGPVTVTDRRVTRYFMTIPEASRLVIQAGALAHGGEVFVLNMGEPVNIYDLAEKMIRLSGRVPGEDIAIETTGLRPGEKLYEELQMQSERTVPTENPDIMVSVGDEVELSEVRRSIDALERAAHECDGAEVKRALARAVPTYTPSFG